MFHLALCFYIVELGFDKPEEISLYYSLYHSILSFSNTKLQGIYIVAVSEAFYPFFCSSLTSFPPVSLGHPLLYDLQPTTTRATTCWRTAYY